MPSRQCPVCGHYENEKTFICSVCGSDTVYSSVDYVESSNKPQAVISPPENKSDDTPSPLIPDTSSYVSPLPTNNIPGSNVTPMPVGYTKRQKKKNWLLVLVVFIVVFILIIYAISSDKKDPTPVPASTEPVSYEPVSVEVISTQVDPRFEIYSDDVENYENILDPNEYYTYKSKTMYYSFSYPTGFYNDVVENTDYNCEYGYCKSCINISGDKGSYVVYRLIERDSDDSFSVEGKTAQIHDIEAQNLFGEVDIINSTTDDHGKVIVSGWNNSNKDFLIYDMYRIDNEYIMEMKVVFPSYSSDTERLQIAYITECYYRMCGFSGTNKEPRSYAEYVEKNS